MEEAGQGRRSSQPSCPVIDFDHHKTPAEHRLDVWRRLREMGPIVRSTCYGGFWAVTSYEAVATVLSDAETYSSAKTEDGEGGQSIPPFLWQRNVPGEYDKEDHQRFKQVLLPPLSHAAVEGRRSIIQGIVRETFDAVQGRESVDATRDIAILVPAHSMFTFMGLPRSDAEPIGLSVHELMGHRRSGYAAPELDAKLAAINQRMLEEVESRRRAPRDDIISLLAHLQHEDRRLNSDELLSVLVTGFLFGGLVTAAETIVQGMIYLDRDRVTRRTLIDQPELFGNFVQDLVRWVTPAPTVARTVTRDTLLAGQALQAGDRVLAMLGSANMDERVFPDPERVDPGKWRNRHVGFGMGVHFCPGASLARVEIEATLRELLKRMPDYEIADLHRMTTGLAAPEGGWLTLRLRPNC